MQPSMQPMRRKRFSGPPRSGGNPNNRPKGKPQHRPGGGYRGHSNGGGNNPNQDPYAAVPLRRAIQMRDKYMEMAKMTQDRTDTEYWLQHADHFNRIVMYHQQNVRYSQPHQQGDHQHQHGDQQQHDGDSRHDRGDRSEHAHRSNRGAPYPENPGDGENDGESSNSNGSIDAEPFVMPTGPGMSYVPSTSYGLTPNDQTPPIIIPEDEE